MEACGKQIRIALRSLRNLEEYWGYTFLEKNNSLKALPPFMPKWPYTMVNPKFFKKFDWRKDLKTGDIIMTRGTTFASAIIGRIPSVDFQFSHLGFVLVEDGTLLGEENKGKLFIVESEPEGMLISPLDTYMGRDLGRFAIFRMRNIKNNAQSTDAAVLAKEAVRQMVTIIKSKKIVYNFLMDISVPPNPADAKQLFCSQLVQAGLLYAETQSGMKMEELGPVRPDKISNFNFPLVFSRMDHESNSLIKLLGITSYFTFAPGDVEIDPRVELIADWRNFPVVPKMRIHDVIFSKIFQWMEEGGYGFPENKTLSAVAVFAVQAGGQVGQIPSGMPSDWGKALLMMGFLSEFSGAGGNLIDYVTIDDSLLEQAGSLIGFNVSTPEGKKQIADLKDMVKSMGRRVLEYRGFTSRIGDVATQYKAKTGLLITDIDMAKSMEILRVEDCRDLKAGNKIRFHDLFYVIDSTQKDYPCKTEAYDWLGGW